MTYAHGGNGTSSHLVMEYFRLLAGFETVPVPYRGAAAMVSDFLAGQFKVSFGSTSGLLPQAAAGPVSRALAVSTAKRSPLAPDVPTIAECGLSAGFESHHRFRAAGAGRSTPAEIVALAGTRGAAGNRHARVQGPLQQAGHLDRGLDFRRGRLAHQGRLRALGRRGRAHRHEGRVGTRWKHASNKDAAVVPRPSERPAVQ